MKKHLLLFFALLAMTTGANADEELYVGGKKVDLTKTSYLSGGTIHLDEGGSVLFDAPTKTLTIKDANITCTDNNQRCINSSVEGLKVVIEGSVWLTAFDAASVRLSGGVSNTISGNGFLAVMSSEEAFFLADGSKLTLAVDSLYAQGDTETIDGDLLGSGSEVTVENGFVTLNNKNKGTAIKSLGTFTVKGFSEVNIKGNGSKATVEKLKKLILQDDISIYQPAQGMFDGASYTIYASGTSTPHKGDIVLTRAIKMTTVNFPDVTFRDYILAIAKDEILTNAERASVKNIDVTKRYIRLLTGVELFPKLQQLRCGNNQIKSLDVSKNTELTTLVCYENELKVLDVSNNTALTELSCYSNMLKSLDVSNNTALKELECYTNQLTALDVSKNTELTTLDCGENTIEALDVSNNKKLVKLYCYDNKLTSLDVSKTKLTHLQCFLNQIYGKQMDALVASLPVSTTTAEHAFCVLEYSPKEGNVITKAQVAAAIARGWTPFRFNVNVGWHYYDGSDPVTIAIDEKNFPDEIFRNYVQENFDTDKDTRLSEEECLDVTTIDVTEKGVSDLKGVELFTNLTRLNCSKNLLTSLDLSKNTKLNYLYCSNNQLTSLDLTQNKVLVELACSNNGLISINTEGCPLYRVVCDGNRLSRLTFVNNTTLIWLYCHNNNIKGSNMDDLIASLPVKETNTEHVLYVLHNNEAEGNVCTQKQVAAAKERGWTVYWNNGLEWKEYQGNTPGSIAINEENFPDLRLRTYLKNESYGKDGIITPEEIASVTYIFVQWCQTLKGIEYFTELRSLTCTGGGEGQRLTEADFSKNTKLTKLDCGGNDLTSLDLSKNTELTTLDCSGNLLSTIDLSNNKKLTDLECDRNQIHGSDMSALIASLPKNTTGAVYQFRVYSPTSSYEANFITKAMVSDAKARGWTPYWYYEGGWKPYEGSDPGVVINKANFPDEIFRNWLLEQDYGQDKLISEEEIANLKEINVDSRWDIVSLKGIEFFTELESLNCHWNKIKELDVSKNTKLTRLYCGKNKFTSLDVSRNTALESLNCSENQLDKLDVSKNTNLTSLDCSNNQLTSIDVSRNTKLTNLGCTNNLLTSIDVSRNTKLTSLSCSNNQLTSLDVTSCKELKYVYCSGNQIKKDAMVKFIRGLNDLIADSHEKKFGAYDEKAEDGNEFYEYMIEVVRDKGWNVSHKGLPYEGYPVIRVLFKDENLYNWAIKQSFAYDFLITDEEAQDVTTIDISGRGITDLSGIDAFKYLKHFDCSNNNLSQGLRGYLEDCKDLETLNISYNQFVFYDWDNLLASFKKLKSLSCSGNPLTYLDLSEFPLLTTLRCSDCQLTQLDVTHNPELQVLECSDNQLTTLDLTQNTELQELACDGNQLTALDLTQNTELQTLYCNGNQLTALDLSQNTKLLTINCFYNQIKGQDMTDFIESLNDNDFFSEIIYKSPRKYKDSIGKALRIIADDSEGYTEGNVITKANVVAASAKGWNVLVYHEDDEGEWYEEEYEGISVDGDVNGDNVADVADIASIISVMAGSADISSEAADVNRDGTVDVADVASVISIMAAKARRLNIED